MTYEMYRYVFLGGAIGCGIMFVVSAILFFVLQIPRVISDLTGRTARKAIDDIRKQNEEGGDKAYKSSTVNKNRGKLTDKISPSGRIVPAEDSPFGVGGSTEKISTQVLAEQARADETTVLGGNETTVLSQGNETTVLSEMQYGETAVLSPEPQYVPEPVVQFTVEYEITYTHTSEVIA